MGCFYPSGTTGRVVSSNTDIFAIKFVLSATCVSEVGFQVFLGDGYILDYRKLQHFYTIFHAIHHMKINVKFIHMKQQFLHGVSYHTLSKNILDFIGVKNVLPIS